VITAERLRHFLDYDAATGVFTWRNPPRCGPRLGAQAGCRNQCGYWRICIGQKSYKAHRLAWLYVYGQWPSERLDHINRDPGDNRIENLRLATRSQNAANKRSLSASGLKGVYFTKSAKHHKRPWGSSIKVNGKSIWLGRHETPEAASLAYMRAASAHFGEYASRK